MAEPLALGFGGLVRQLRAEAGLTQQELAEAASLCPRSVSDLERGIHRTARKDTAELLAGALGLAEPARPCSWRPPAVAPRPKRYWQPCAEAAAPECSGRARRGRAAPIWGWCRSRSGTPGSFTDATSWRISWCGGWRSGRTGRGYCWWPASRVGQVLAAAGGIAAALAVGALGPGRSDGRGG